MSTLASMAWEPGSYQLTCDGRKDYGAVAWCIATIS